jgi:hypothetical protein
MHFGRRLRREIQQRPSNRKRIRRSGDQDYSWRMALNSDLVK